MCAIFGAFSKSMYEVLMAANVDRGNFAYSHCFVNKGTVPLSIQRFDKILPPEKIKASDNIKYFFGHYQAPTSFVEYWDVKTSHPFIEGDWVVAHNGVITNFEDLEVDFTSNHTLQIDSNIIPIILDHFYKKTQNVVTSIEKTFDLIEGTAAVWIVNTKHKQSFILRQGSTLFANKKTGCFSSVECSSKEWCALDEGAVYEINYKRKKLVEVGNFKVKSPFLFV